MTPTLAEIAADETLIEALDPQKAASLSAQASALAGRLAMRVVLVQPLDPTVPDQALSVQQAALRLGKAPSSLYRLVRQEPYRSLRVPTGNRTIRFSARRIQEYLSGTVTPGPTRGTPAHLGRRKGIIPRPARPPVCVRGGQGGE